MQKEESLGVGGWEEETRSQSIWNVSFFLFLSWRKTVWMSFPESYPKRNGKKKNKKGILLVICGVENSILTKFLPFHTPFETKFLPFHTLFRIQGKLYFPNTRQINNNIIWIFEFKYTDPLHTPKTAHGRLKTGPPPTTTTTRTTLSSPWSVGCAAGKKAWHSPITTLHTSSSERT